MTDEVHISANASARRLRRRLQVESARWLSLTLAGLGVFAVLAVVLSAIGVYLELATAGQARAIVDAGLPATAVVAGLALLVCLARAFAGSFSENTYVAERRSRRAAALAIVSLALIAALALVQGQAAVRGALNYVGGSQ